MTPGGPPTSGVGLNTPPPTEIELSWALRGSIPGVLGVPGVLRKGSGRVALLNYFFSAWTYKDKGPTRISHVSGNASPRKPLTCCQRPRDVNNRPRYVPAPASGGEVTIGVGFVLVSFWFRLRFCRRFKTEPIPKRSQNETKCGWGIPSERRYRP